MAGMEGAFEIVLFVVVGVAVVGAVVSLVLSSGAFEQIGRGRMSIGEDRPPAGEPTAVQGAEREAEIRQLLEARNARRAARGQQPADVDAELAGLLRPSVEPGIEDEVRQLVLARNARRAERGEEPLDVEAEVARRLRELG